LYIVLAPLYLKSVRKLQEKRFVFVKILAIIIPENGAKVSKIKCFQFAQQTLNKDEERKGLFSMIDDVQITNSHIMVAGSMAVEDEGTKIVVYDYDGNQLLKLGGEDISSPDKLGSITGMAETENGFVAADGNMREIQFWAKDGTHVGAISTEDIFGVSYPWLEDMQLLDDGSLLIMLTQERDDGSANELMFFRLTGF